MFNFTLDSHSTLLNLCHIPARLGHFGFLSSFNLPCSYLFLFCFCFLFPLSYFSCPLFVYILVPPTLLPFPPIYLLFLCSLPPSPLSKTPANALSLRKS